MTSDQLNSLLQRMQCVRVGSCLQAPCPICQEQPVEPEDYKLLVNPGSSYALLAFCVKCMTPKPQTDADRQHNRSVSRQIWQAVGGDLDLIFSRMDAGDIRRLWSQIRIGGQGVAQEEPDRTSDQLLFMAYDSLLDSLDLNIQHRAWLRKRGLDPDWCYEIGYRSGDGPVASTLHVTGVPGLVNGEWKVRRDCLLVPCRDRDGLILSVKMRLFDKSRKKMRTLSSVGWGGPKGQAIIHYPLGVQVEQGCELWITEGERKADVIWHKQHHPVLGLPGVNFASRSVGIGRQAGSVVLAFDDDAAGRRAGDQVGRVLLEQGVAVRVARWEGHKGIDDALAAGSEIRIEEWGDGGGKAVNTSPPTKKSIPNGKLKDHEILPHLKSIGPVLRSSLNCYQPLLSEYIRKGMVKMVKTPNGQVVEAV